MYIRTVNDNKTTPSKRKVKFIINQIERDGKDAYFAEARYKEMAFFIAITPKLKKELCS